MQRAGNELIRRIFAIEYDAFFESANPDLMLGKQYDQSEARIGESARSARKYTVKKGPLTWS